MEPTKGFQISSRSKVCSEVQISSSFMLCAFFITELNWSLALSTPVDTNHGCEERKELGSPLGPILPDSPVKIQFSFWARISASNSYSHPTTLKKRKKEKKERKKERKKEERKENTQNTEINFTAGKRHHGEALPTIHIL